MSTKLPDDPSFGVETPNRKTILTIGLSLIGTFFLINDIVGLIEGGGLFSFISALGAIKHGLPAIDIDENALRTLFIVAVIIPVIAVCIRLNINLKARVPSTVFALLVIGGPFIADEIWGQRIITAYMAHRGYHRCVSADYARGSGKSRVWFKDYVHSSEGCWVDRLAELAKHLPKRTGPITRLDHITLTNIYVAYSYTLTDRAGSPLDQQVADKVARNSPYIDHELRADVCANRLHNGLAYGLIENFGYAGKSGIVLMVSVSPGSCPPVPEGAARQTAL